MELEKFYRDIYYCCRKEADWNRETIIGDVRVLLPQIQEFTKLISDQDNFEMEEKEYQNFLEYYMTIIQDVVSAIENRDVVLLFDSLAYGLLDVIILFLPEGEWERL